MGETLAEHGTVTGDSGGWQGEAVEKDAAGEFASPSSQLETANGFQLSELVFQ